MKEEEKKAIENLNIFANTFYGSFSMNEAKTVLNLITKLQKENETICKLNANMSKRHLNDTFKIKNYAEELKKYDYRNIKIDEENKIKSPSFTKEQLYLMNLGIALYVGIPKLLEDEEGEIEV